MDRPFVDFRGMPVMDGGYSANFDQICPPGVEVCIKISAYFTGPNNPTGDYWWVMLSPAAIVPMCVTHMPRILAHHDAHGHVAVSRSYCRHRFQEFSSLITEA